MTLFTWKGAPVSVHGSLVLLGGASVLVQLLGVGPGAALGALAVGIALFGSVLLHELGHAVVARRFGVSTHRIVLYPFGGIASLDREPDTPRAEALVALAGPGVNFALVLAALPLAALGVPGVGLFIAVNLGLGLFNLVPAFPMDGGRVLRAWWTVRHGRTDATLRALGVSRVFAGLFLIGGLLGNLSLLLVGGLLWMIVRSERRRWRSAAAYRRSTGREAPWMQPGFGGDPQAAAG